MSLSARMHTRISKTAASIFVATALVLLIGLGAMGKNGGLPSTDPLSGKKNGWFGRERPRNASSSWNPFAAPLPSPTSQLSKEYS